MLWALPTTSSDALWSHVSVVTSVPFPDRLSRVLINRGFARLWAAATISGFGDAMFETTLLVWIVSDLAEGRSWAPFVSGGVLAASAVPVLLVGPIAGALIDRWPDKLRVLQRTNLISAGLVAALLPVAVLPGSVFGGGARADGARLVLVLLVVVLASAVAQFLRPASGVLGRDIVPEADRPRAAGLTQTAANVTMLVAPSLAAPVLIAFGPGIALSVNAASFCVAYALIRGLRVEAPESVSAPDTPATPRAVLRDMVDGLRFFRASPVLMTIAVTFCLAMLGFGAMNALDIFFLRDNLGVDTRLFGLMESAQGAGMIAGAIVWGLFAARVGLERLFWLSIGALGILTIIYSRLASFPPALALNAVIGLVIPAISVALSPILLRETPRHLLGRVTSTLNPLISGASLVGMLAGSVLFGTVLDDVDTDVWGVHLGPLGTLFLGIGVLTLGVAAFAAARLRPHPPADAQDPAT